MGTCIRFAPPSAFKWHVSPSTIASRLYPPSRTEMHGTAGPTASRTRRVMEKKLLPVGSGGGREGWMGERNERNSGLVW